MGLIRVPMGLMYVNSMFQGVQYIFFPVFSCFSSFFLLKEESFPRKQGFLKHPETQKCLKKIRRKITLPSHFFQYYFLLSPHPEQY